MDIKTDKDKITKIKKFLAFVLRHKPFFYKIKLDTDGFAGSEDLAKAVSNNLKMDVKKEDLIEIVKKYSGGIFVASKDSSKIAARDGHTFIFNMNVPDGFVKTNNVPKTLYGLITKKDFSNIFSSDIVPLSNKKVFLATVSPKEDDKNVILTINTQKTLKKTGEFYYNEDEGLYYAKFVTTDSIIIHV